MIGIGMIGIGMIGIGMIGGGMMIHSTRSCVPVGRIYGRLDSEALDKRLCHWGQGWISRNATCTWIPVSSHQSTPCKRGYWIWLPGSCSEVGTFDSLRCCHHAGKTKKQFNFFVYLFNLKMSIWTKIKYKQ
jgi:hypothetical protein